MIPALLTLLCLLTPAADMQPYLTASGIARLGDVAELRFAFHVERNGQLAASRRWVWRPSTNEVELTEGEATHRYDRDAMTEADRAADAKFINDTFWLLPAMHLSWAPPQLDVQSLGEVDAPLNQGPATHLRVTYPGDGGYTPGDAYDLFIDDAGDLVAWHYRKGGSETPTLTTTFEQHENHPPLRVATEHRNADGSFRLWLTDITVTQR